MSRHDLILRLGGTAEFAHPSARLEQLAAPPEAAAELLGTAYERDDLVGRTVLDLGTGTGRLAIGAALLGALTVVGVDADAAALRLAETSARRAGVECSWVESPVSDYAQRADTVIMNPPFGAQTPHADRPFWRCALALASRAIYSFALRDSRTFIARNVVAGGARIEECRPVRWELPPTLPHHRRARVPIAVDLWVVRKELIPS